MPVYNYSAMDPNTNRLTQGRLEAPNLKVAKELIRSQGRILTSLEEDVELVNVGQLSEQVPILGELFQKRIPRKAVLAFTEQFYTLLESGISLLESLFILEQQTENPQLQDVVKQVRADVLAGDELSKALAKHPNVFGALYINMIRAGEVSGEMESIMARLAQLLEKEVGTQDKVKQAMTMPAITVSVILLVITVIMIFLIPRVEELFSGFGVELPFFTVALIATSKFMVNFWWALALVIIVLIAAFNVFRKGNGKPVVDQWLLTLPVIGNLYKRIYTSLFCRALGTLFASGVALNEGIGIAAKTVDNYVLRLAIERAKESILIGGSLAKPLEQSEAFPIMVAKMIAVGEETGQLDVMLDKSANFLDREVDNLITTMTKLIEPILVVVLGGFLTVVALSVFLPLWSVADVFNK